MQNGPKPDIPIDRLIWAIHRSLRCVDWPLLSGDISISRSSSNGNLNSKRRGGSAIFFEKFGPHLCHSSQLCHSGGSHGIHDGVR